jgi:polyphosphate glucokinase
MKNIILGIDIGATGVKGGLVDVKKGVMTTERFRFDTPHPATPAAMAATVQKLVDHFSYQGPVGVGFPAIVRRGVAVSAANIDDSWVGTDITKVFEKKTGLPFFAVNDADAAGIATMAFGTGKPYNKNGVVVMITIGTGLGGALFVDGKMMPNFEIGQIFLKYQKVVAEKYISNKVRKDNNLSWAEFGKRFNKFIRHVDAVFNPDLIVLGGGASKHFAEYKKYLKPHAEIKPAVLANTAGTVGAAVYAATYSHLVK